MADKVEVEVVGKSKYETAHQMAFNIITIVEKTKLSEVSREHYLKAVSDSIQALNGHMS